MFTTSVRGGKAFVAEQKIRELKTKKSKLNAQKYKISPAKTILISAENISNVQSEKYGLTPEEIEKKIISNERFRTIFHIYWIERTKLVHDGLNRYDKKKYDRKKKNWEKIWTLTRKFWCWQKELEKNQSQESFTKNLFKIYLTLTKRK